MRVLALILASTWFFPVSCTLGTAAGTHLVAALDARDASKGDSMHAAFRVAAEPGERGKPFRVLTLDEAKRAGASLRLSKPQATISIDQSRYTYRVLADERGEQLVELVEDFRNGDKTMWSRYRATANAVTPVSSRMQHPGYMFGAFLFAFALALALNLAGKALLRRYPPAAKPAG